MKTNNIKNIVSFLIKNKITISASESFTGGLFSSKIVSIPNSSTIFKGSIVSYSLESKNKLLKIPLSFLEKNGTISQKTSIAMALRTRELFKTDIAISFTGNAGPIASENKEIGVYYISIYYNEKLKIFAFKSLLIDRKDIIEEAVVKGFELIEELIM